jgi:hypothetical protein
MTRPWNANMVTLRHHRPPLKTLPDDWRDCAAPHTDAASMLPAAEVLAEEGITEPAHEGAIPCENCTPPRTRSRTMC